MSLEEQITIKGEYPLKGVITVPAEQSETYPAILILSGSGPTDRDGNVPKKRLFINMYNQLADELTEAGSSHCVTIREGQGRVEETSILRECGI